MIKYESGNDDDEIEHLCSTWKENLQYFDERKLRQHAETLVSDISKFLFDFSSNSQKYTTYGSKFMEIAKSNGYSDDAIRHVDVYWIHKQSFSNLMLDDDIKTYGKYFYELIIDTTTESADERAEKIVNADLIDDFTREYLVARYVMSHLSSCRLDVIFNNSKLVNVRSFMDAVLKHEDVRVECDGLIEAFKNSALTLHYCIIENQVFLLDFLFSNVLNQLDIETVQKILNEKDSSGSNILHVACETRTKFVLEEIWNLIYSSYQGDQKAIEKYLLQKNDNDKNAFVIAFQMPQKYKNSDYANEIKNRTTLLNYYRDRGPLELEMYNFESSLNFILDIGRKNISDKCRKGLILSQKRKAEKCFDPYSYSRDFKEFRCDFLQLRFYCITKFSLISPKSEKVSLVYQFLSRYIEQYLYEKCDNEEAIIALYQKLSFDSFLGDFFKALVLNNFHFAIAKMETAGNLERLISIAKKILDANEFHKILTKSGASGNNALQLIITSANAEMFRVLWSSFESGPKQITNWILGKNIDGINSLYMIIQSHQYDMLQIMLSYFSCTLEEEHIMYVLGNTGKASYKIIDIAVLFYDQHVFDLLIDFLNNHVSIHNQKTLISEGLIFLAVSKWQESALGKVLNMIEGIFEENEIKEFINYKNWEEQTAFHAASKNKNLTPLQMLCKFAHYYLSKDDFIEVLKAKDKNEYSCVINDQIPDDVLYTELPKLSNFYSTYPVYEWYPLSNLEFPIDGYCFETDNEGNELYIAKISHDNLDNSSIEVAALSKNSAIDFNEACVDILCGRGLSWLPRTSEYFAPIRIENQQVQYITRIDNEVKLIDINSIEDQEILCTNDQNLLQIDDCSGYIFNRIN